jgi:hypothetical protein
MMHDAPISDLELRSERNGLPSTSEACNTFSDLLACLQYSVVVAGRATASPHETADSPTSLISLCMPSPADRIGPKGVLAATTSNIPATGPQIGGNTPWDINLRHVEPT